MQIPGVSWAHSVSTGAAGKPRDVGAGISDCGMCVSQVSHNAKVAGDLDFGEMLRILFVWVSQLPLSVASEEDVGGMSRAFLGVVTSTGYTMVAV
jgi:hypothetical protein